MRKLEITVTEKTKNLIVNFFEDDNLIGLPVEYNSLNDKLQIDIPSGASYRWLNNEIKNPGD